MAEQPYRKPAPAPVPRQKGRVVERSESPDEREAREARELAQARKDSFRAQSALVASELEEARKRFDRGLRIAGAALLGISVLAIGLHADAIASGATYVTVGRIGPLGLTLGPFLVVTGSAGASRKESLPVWWRGAVIGLVLVSTFALRFLEIEIAEWIANTFMP